jgi:hypothetical protein
MLHKYSKTEQNSSTSTANSLSLLSLTASLCTQCVSNALTLRVLGPNGAAVVGAAVVTGAGVGLPAAAFGFRCKCRLTEGGFLPPWTIFLLATVSLPSGPITRVVSTMTGL